MQLKVRDAARLLSVSEKQIQSWIREKSLPARDFNGQCRLNRAEVLEWAVAQGIKIPAEASSENLEGVPGILRLGEALRRGGVFYEVDGADKASAIRAVVERMPVPKDLNRDFLFRILIAREAMASTGIGDKIAIPHPRNPIILRVQEPIVTLCFLKKPVEFQAIDGRPVDTLFTLMAPNVSVHLKLLSRLAYALQNPSFKEKISKKSPSNEILSLADKIDDQTQLPPAKQGKKDGRLA